MCTSTASVGFGGVWITLLCALAMACGDDGAASDDPIYVDQGAEAGGNGTQARPFQAFDEALAAVLPGGLIVVASGLYEVPSSFTFANDLSVLGSIASPTRFVADTSDARIVWQTASAATLFLRDIRFEDALQLTGGNVQLNTLAISGNGPVLSFADTMATATSLDIQVAALGTSDYPGDAVVVRQSSLTWNKGSASEALDRALVVEQSTLALSELTLSASGRGAIQVLDGSEVDASNLTLEDSPAALFVLASRVTLRDARVARSAQPAILVGTGSSATLIDSTFSDCNAGFIAASAGALSLDLRGNDFLGSQNDNCITSSAGTIIAKDNTIDTCAGAGILVLDGQEIEISGNLIQNIHFDKLIGIVASGIDLNGATGLLSTNTIKATLDAGISMTNSVLTLDSNVIGPVGGSGISYVSGPAEATTISNNDISQAVGAGIIALGASVNITGNQVSMSAVSSEGFADGIVFGSGAIANVSANTLSNNLHNGILFLNGAQGSVMGNTASGNVEYGLREICVGDANAVSVGTNALSGNTIGDQTLCSP